MSLSSPLQATTFSATWPTICPSMNLTLGRLERGALECSIGKAVVCQRQFSTAASVASICPWLHLLSGPSCYRRLAGILVTGLPRTAVRAVAPAADGLQTSTGPEASFEGNAEVRETDPGANVRGVSGLNKESSKECKECHRVKLLLDFERSVNGVDGRTELCRACLATFRAKRFQRDPPHLNLSVEEAWKRGRKCSGCGTFKEIRDFAKDSQKKDGLSRKCRACGSEANNRKPIKQPIDISQKCMGCSKVKAAAEFYRKRKGPLGLQAWCKDCQRQLQKKRRPMLVTSPKLATEEKRCGVCHVVKKIADFSPSNYHIDGLKHDCKACCAAARRIRGGTMSLQKGAHRGPSERSRKHMEGGSSLRKGLDISVSNEILDNTDTTS